MDVAPALTVITQNYGCTSFPEYVCCGCPQYFHYGIDLSSGNASNQPQYATRPGTVYAAGPGVVPGQPGLGTAVIVSMDDGFDMLYGHFWSVAVGAGQRVGPGTVVGYTGSTGYSTGPHAHIEVRQRGNLNASPNGVQNPWAWLSFGGDEDMTPQQERTLNQIWNFLFWGGDGEVQASMGDTWLNKSISMLFNFQYYGGDGRVGEPWNSQMLKHLAARLDQLAAAAEIREKLAVPQFEESSDPVPLDKPPEPAQTE